MCATYGQTDAHNLSDLRLLRARFIEISWVNGCYCVHMRTLNCTTACLDCIQLVTAGYLSADVDTVKISYSSSNWTWARHFRYCKDRYSIKFVTEHVLKGKTSAALLFGGVTTDRTAVLTFWQNVNALSVKRKLLPILFVSVMDQGTPIWALLEAMTVCVIALLIEALHWELTISLV
jgi:hypothetical protein